MRKLMWALVAACAVLAGCADKPVAPFASAPFSVARKGNALSLPFTAPPAAPLEHTYMLAFKYQGPELGDPLLDFWSRPQRAHLFMKVRLVSLGNDGTETNVDLNGWDNGDGSVQLARSHGPDVFNVDMHGVRLGVADMEVVFFKLPRHGAYRFDIETVADSAMFEPIASWVTVEREYRRYK